MPKQRSKSSMMRSTLGRSVPAICISKPDGYACNLYKYNCDGTFAGRIASDAETADQCRAAAAALEECKIYMVFFDQKTLTKVNESFDNCTDPPPPYGIWNPQTVTSAGENAEFTYTQGVAAGTLTVLSDDFGFLFWTGVGFTYRFATRKLTGEQFTQLFYSGTPTPNVEWAYWSGGTYEDAPEPPP
jgi:hypothetical protein